MDFIMDDKEIEITYCPSFEGKKKEDVVIKDERNFWRKSIIPQNFRDKLEKHTLKRPSRSKKNGAQKTK